MALKWHDASMLEAISEAGVEDTLDADAEFAEDFQTTTYLYAYGGELTEKA